MSLPLPVNMRPVEMFELMFQR